MREYGIVESHWCFLELFLENVVTKRTIKNIHDSQRDRHDFSFLEEKTLGFSIDDFFMDADTDTPSNHGE